MLVRLAGQPDAILARLHALHAWTVSAQGREDGVLEEVALARGMARATDDPYLELDVLDHASAAEDEVDASSDANWAELESRARELGAWRHVVTAARVRATYRAADDPHGAVPMVEEAAAVAHAHGLVEQAGWCDLTRAELLWVLGRWEEARSACAAVIALAEANGYERLAFRTYVVALPLAAAIRDPTVAERFHAWDAGLDHRGPAVQSPYARVLRAAIRAWGSAARGEPLAVPPPDVLEAIVPMMNPHYLAAVETLVTAWIGAGSDELATAAADRVSAFAGEEGATRLMHASAALVGVWVGRTGPDAAIQAAREADGPWWTARALRAAGRSAEAEEIETTLGVPPA